MLAGIFLTDEVGDHSGGVWVWPGSHLVHERLFRERGTRALVANDGHITLLDSPPPLADPTPVCRVRRMLYYRLGCPDHSARWEATFTDVFTEYQPVRHVLCP